MNSCEFSVKGYLRKGTIYTAMKDSTKATHAYQKALEIDPNCAVSTHSTQYGGDPASYITMKLLY